MNRFFIFTFIAMIFIGISANAETLGEGGWRIDEKQIRIEVDHTGIVTQFYDLKYNFDFYGPEFDHIIAYVTPEELAKIKSLGIPYIVEIEDLNQHSLSNRGILEAYHSYQEIIDLADSLVTAFPTICEKHIFGTSLGGRQLAALKISDNVSADEPEAEVMFDGGIHGDEIGASENVIRFARDLCRKYGSDPVVTELINNREIWLYLMVNPDGRVNMTRYNNNGVDLNRDWQYMWDAWGGSNGPCNEVESKALRECMYNNQFVVHTTYHSGTEYISLPWSYRGSQPLDWSHLYQLGGLYSSSSGYSNLTYGQGNSGMYPINGSTKDSNYGMMGSASWTMEISLSKQPPASQIMTYYNYNYPSMIKMIEYAGYGLQGTITDSITGNPITANVFVNNYYPTYSDPTAGDYHKYVLPGTYSIKIVANGYQTKTINNVVVTANNATTTNFQLRANDNRYVYRFTASQIPNNNESDEGLTPAVIGPPDNINYSIGVNGWVVLDMQSAIFDGSAYDFKVYEGDTSPEGYTCYVSETMDGPWYNLGTGNGTTSFDISSTGLQQIQFIKLVDDGNGTATSADAGFDLDAIEVLPITGPYLYTLNLVVDDSNNNNNGIAERGETVDINLYLANLGIDDANNISGSITCSDPMLSIINGITNISSVSASDTVVAGIFTVQINQSTPHLHNCSIILNLTADSAGVPNAYSWNQTLQLEIHGGSKITLMKQSLSYPNTCYSFTTTAQMPIINNGPETLEISGITSDLPQFSSGISSLSIAPGVTRNIDVSFTPDTTSTYNGTITIMNNDPLNFVTTFPVSGTGIHAPVIAMIDTIRQNANPTDSIVVPVTITNSGLGELQYTAQISGFDPNNPSTRLKEDGGSDNYGHMWIDSDMQNGPEFNWIDITSTGTLIPITGSNAISDTLDLGFTFNFYGNNYDNVRVCTNGWISFTSYTVAYNNFALPSAIAPRSMIAALWDNLNFLTNSKVYFENIGNQTVILYENVYTVYGEGPFTFEIILYDNENIILQYLSLNNLTNTYTVGIQNFNGDDGITIAHNEPYLHDSLAVMISRAIWVSVSPMSGTLLSGGSQDLNLTFLTNEFAIGNYWASLHINSNDPANGHLVIPIKLTVDLFGGIENEGLFTIEGFHLYQNSPNPFNPTTTITYNLPNASDVELVIYNMLGQKVKTLVNAHQKAQLHHAVWDGTDDHGISVASGLYLYRIKTAENTAFNKMIFMK